MNGQPSNPQEAALPLPPSAPMPEAEDLLATMRFQPSQHALPSRLDVTSASRTSGGVRQQWRVVALRVTGSFARATVRSRIALGSITRMHSSLACATVGAAMIAASIVAGWSSTSSASLDKLGTAASAIVIARVAMAIATMFTGASLLKLSERLSSVSSAVRIIGRER